MGNKIKTSEDYEDKIRSLTRKKMQMIVDIGNLDKELDKTSEKFYELSPDYERMICLTCGGEGIIDNKETGKREICRNEMLPMLSCGGKKYIWLKKYIESVIK